MLRSLLPLALLTTLLALACNSQPKATTTTNATVSTVSAQVPDYRYDPPAEAGVVIPFDTTEAYWRSILTDQEYEILREDGTERSFTSPLLDEKRAGIFTCACCGLPLFASETKYESGTGWPSFYQPIDEAYIRQDVDTRYGMRRVEVSCARCNGHLGHVFPDGPEPTGLRYCLNGASLDFVPAEDL